MSDWKNPTTDKGRRKEWNTPIVKDEQLENVAAGISVAIKGVVGFVLIASVNALAIMGVVNLLGNDISYRNALGIGGIYVLWRAYDKVIFSRFRPAQ